MITKWAKNAVRASLLISYTATTALKIKRADGSWASIRNTRSTTSGDRVGLNIISTPSCETRYLSYGYPRGTNIACICLGSGTTPPTDDDYNLESIIENSNISTSVYASDETDQSGNPGRKFQITMNNGSSSPITISEIGYYSSIVGSTETNPASVLVDRTLLDTPVTIPANDYAIIVYEIFLDVSDLSGLA